MNHSEGNLKGRLREIEFDMADFHISSYLYKKLEKEKKMIIKELSSKYGIEIKE